MKPDFYIYECLCHQRGKTEHRVRVFKTEEEAKINVKDVIEFYETIGIVEYCEHFNDNFGYGARMKLENKEWVFVRCYGDNFE